MYIFSYQKPLKRRKTFNKIVILITLKLHLDEVLQTNDS